MEFARNSKQPQFYRDALGSLNGTMIPLVCFVRTKIHFWEVDYVPDK